VTGADPTTWLRAAGARPGGPVGLAPAADGLGLALPGGTLAVPGDPAALAAAVEADLRPRWVCWDARSLATALLPAGVRLRACWDLVAVHRLLHGGSASSPDQVWAAAHGLPATGVPRAGQLDLLTAPDPAPPVPSVPSGRAARSDPADGPVQDDGYLRLGWADGVPSDLGRAAVWAGLALAVRELQASALAALPDGRRQPSAPPLAVLTAWSESAAQLLCGELQTAGLPLDPHLLERLLTARIGARPADAAAEVAAREARDARVRVHLGSDLDLRNPASVRAALLASGVDVPDTRSWRLESLRTVHPGVAALLDWRRSERLATTYGYGWLDRHVGPDGRLRGAWQGSDGAAGRMTAQAGLHSLPAELRPAVRAEPGRVLVRADLGQVEPRVLAAVSGDEGLAAAAAEDDLYAPVARRLGCDRPTAKVAVLAAMYGQTTGTAGEALRGLDAAYPVAMRHLRAAEAQGRAGRDVRTYGGRLVRTAGLDRTDPPTEAAVRARGRFARNAVVQGAAAELFKMWAASVRTRLASGDGSTGGEIVLCLHDELLLHVPADAADETARLLHETLTAASGRWAAGSGVRFVADVAVRDRWSGTEPGPDPVTAPAPG
jgi:DNA polymerase-1